MNFVLGKCLISLSPPPRRYSCYKGSLAFLIKVTSLPNSVLELRENSRRPPTTLKGSPLFIYLLRFDFLIKLFKKYYFNVIRQKCWCDAN